MGISAKDLERMQARLKEGTSLAESTDSKDDFSPGGKVPTILGIDPSLRGTGYGVICGRASRFITLAQGTIQCRKTWTHSRCLAHIGETLDEVLRETKPTVCVVEGLFFAQNIKTAIVMGEARGAAMSVVARTGISIYEISPRKVKQAIVGYGAAQKEAVSKMVQRMLELAEQPDPDAADALALALTFAQEQGPHRLNQPKEI